MINAIRIIPRSCAKLYSDIIYTIHARTGTVLRQGLLERTDAAVSAISRVVLVRACGGRVIVVLVESLHCVLGHIPVDKTKDEYD